MVKINGKEHNPAQWEDSNYSVEGAAARLGDFPGTIHTWLKVGKLTGYQLAKGMPWKVYLTEEDVYVFKNGFDEQDESEKRKSYEST